MKPWRRATRYPKPQLRGHSFLLPMSFEDISLPAIQAMVGDFVEWISRTFEPVCLPFLSNLSQFLNAASAHPYGNKNFAKGCSNFSHHVEDVRQALLRYKEWCSQGQNASRLLLGLKVCKGHKSLTSF